MAAYYNEIDPKAAAWLRQLIQMGLIADGVVDTRSITDVQAKDLKEFKQCHFFAGIGGWSYALRLAGIPDESPVWTGSCPCQSFSNAGKRKGVNDDRHLWPEFYRLIKQCRPVTVFGEQVESAIRFGWLDDLQADMERENYAVGATVLGAHSVSAPHQRQRLYWVANSKSYRIGRECRPSNCEEGETQSGRRYENRKFAQFGAGSTVSSMGNTEHDGYPACQIAASYVQPSEEWGQKEPYISREFKGASGREDAASLSGCESGRSYRHNSESIWYNPEWLYCRDNKYRPIKSSTKPLVDGIPRGVVYSGGEINPDNCGFARDTRLKGYGNAIVPQVAAEFISAFYDVI